MEGIGDQLSRLTEGYASGTIEPAGFVRGLYALLLGREVDPDSMRYYLDEETSLGTLATTLIDSTEFRDRWRNAPGFYRAPVQLGGGKRVLLFGAYGNGNLGDSIQPAALARAIASIRPDIEVWACSRLPAQFEFPLDRVLPSDMLGNRQTLESFDLLLIGGGGLLAHPHDPLIDPYWQAHLPMPFALFGIGAREPAIALSEPLVAGASMVAGRDRSSVALFAARRGDAVEQVADPVLCDSTLERPGRPPGKGGSLLWVLKQEQLGASEPLLAQIDPHRDRICFLEPHRDFGIIARWPGAQPVYRLKELVDLVEASDGVVSMRFHGAIVAALRGLPLFAVGEDKSAELLERLGVGEAYHPRGDGFDRDESLRTVARSAIRGERRTYLAQLGTLLDRYC